MHFAVKAIAVACLLFAICTRKKICASTVCCLLFAVRKKNLCGVPPQLSRLRSALTPRPPTPSHPGVGRAAASCHHARVLPYAALQHHSDRTACAPRSLAVGSCWAQSATSWPAGDIGNWVAQVHLLNGGIVGSCQTANVLGAWREFWVILAILSRQFKSLPLHGLRARILGTVRLYSIFQEIFAYIE